VRGLALLALAYLCGSIPSGVLLARRAGVDVRRAGSGNIGAANVARTAGLGLGLLTLLFDSAKGALPVLVGHAMAATPALQAGAGLAAFAGHIFPPTLRFAGGKGVATAFGVLLALHPGSAGIGAAVFAVTFWWTRYVSVASVLGALAVPIAMAALGGPFAAGVVATVMAGAILLRHRDNFRRLRSGTEPRFRMHKEQAVLSK
jgi:glycerol-3-phosphate acyltransferase PlsY